jgi:pimeloyl-ACP methyl ester carboxylesterase
LSGIVLNRAGVESAGGSREPLLLIHGLGGSRSVWEPVLGLLAPEREVFALDMPGFGAAESLPPGAQPTPRDLAAALHEQCLELGIERPHVAGNSLGGWVALEMGRYGWAASVTALSPAGLWRKPLGGRPREVRYWARRLRPAVALAARVPGVRHRMLATFAAHPERIPAEVGRQLVLDWVDAEGYDGANRAMRTFVFDARDYPAEVPVTIAWSELDRLLGPPKPERRPAGARYLVLPGVGHTPTWDDPELVARTLLEGSAVTSVEPELAGPKEEQR